MSKDADPGFDLDAIAGALGGLVEAAAAGLEAIDEAGESAAGGDPTHRIVVDVDLQANVDGHPYRVDATLTYEAELAPYLDAPAGGDLAGLLGGLGIDTGGEEGAAILEQLGSPRVIGGFVGADVRDHVLHSEDGPEDAVPGEGSSMLVTIDGDRLRCSFEQAFSYPALQASRMVFCATPSGELMQEHVVVETGRLDEPVSFGWTEDDKDGLRIEGTVRVVEI